MNMSSERKFQVRLGVKEVVKLVKITWQVKHKNVYVESIKSQLQKTRNTAQTCETTYRLY